MLIEFLGLPGCGKSTLSHSVAEQLRREGRAVNEATYILNHRRHKLERLLRKLGHLTDYAAHHPRVAWSDIRAIQRTRQASLADLRNSGMNWLYVSSIVVSRPFRPSVGMITILDQGIAQAVWSIGWAAQSDTWLDLLSPPAGHACAMPHLVVSVRADLETIGSRLEARRVRASRMDARARDLEALRRAEAKKEAVVSKLCAMEVPIFEAKNNDVDEMTSSAREIASVIKNMPLMHGPALKAKVGGNAKFKAGSTEGALTF
jgi:ABC-type dipeptide/oligopeptide/nickel transport system ATPase component